MTIEDAAGKAVRKSAILVNSPVQGRPVHVLPGQLRRQDPGSSTLEVTSDPGVPLVFAGFILLPIGIALAIYAEAASQPGRRE